MDYSPKKMQQNLDKKNFRFKKNFGQNFIVDENIIKSIIARCDIDEHTMVLEIGPGAGSLTYQLALKASNVLCYEVDTKLKEILDENLSEFSNVEILYEDFLKSDVKEKLKEYTYNKLYVVANLPYYITTPIITKIIEDELDVDKIVVMVQKEVGDRFKAKAGSRDYGSLSVFLNYYYDIRKILDVSRNVFLPRPNVDSIVVEFSKKESTLYLEDKNIFFNLIRDAFRQKRKTLKNNLRNYNLDLIEKVLLKNNLDLSVRAELLSLDIFVDLANTISRGMYENK